MTHELLRPARARGLAAVAVLAAALALAGATPASAQPSSGADLAVDLRANALLLLTGARYTVAVTNNGPQALSSATVVVRLDPRTTGISPGPCTGDTVADTVTCQFAGLAVGATATATFVATFTLPYQATSVAATAARTASSPPDGNAANDSDTFTCGWYQDPGLLPPFTLHC
jgi:uncharacterized protein DUF11